MTEQYAVIGHPITQSLSPQIHAHFSRQTGKKIKYGRIDCVSAKLEETVRKFFADGGRGLNITAPHKNKAFRIADKIGTRGRNAGAINILTRHNDGTLVGDNTDGSGLIRDLKKNLRIKLDGASILLLGAGGSARGAIMPLAREKPERITIANRTHANALKLIESFAGLSRLNACQLDKLTADYDVVIHATAAGLKNRVPILDGNIIRKADCYDLMYSRHETPFIKWAHRQGAKSVHDGWGMLIEQAAESFNIWTGVWPDTNALLEARPSKRRPGNDPSA